MKKQLLMGLDLQFFAADDGGATAAGGTNGDGEGQGTKNTETNPTEGDEGGEGDGAKPANKGDRTFSRAELAKIVKEETDKALQVERDKQAEAAKLKGMNADDKVQYELDKVKAELESERKTNAYNAMSKEASTMLSEAEITADENILAMVVKDSAEDTKTTVESFIKLVDSVSEAKTKKALTGKAPTLNLQPGKTITKSDIMRVKNDTERQRLIKENIHLFKK